MKLVHQALNLFYQTKVRQFTANLNHLQPVQESSLHQILHSLPIKTFPKTYGEFTQRFPVTKYADWEEKIRLQMDSGEEIVAKNVQRFEPTSGSTHTRKWIPYSARFLAELNESAAVWMGDLYCSYPQIKEGSHFWSLSWLPEDLRQKMTADDSELFPWWQRYFLQSIMTLPPGMNGIRTMDAFWFALLCFLAADQDLSLISVWSPTMLLRITSELQEKWPAISTTINSGKWSQFSEELQHLNAPRRKKLNTFNLKTLWPKLALISSWDSSSSREFANILRQQFPQVPMQGKGLWATEGVVTIPFQGKYPLAINSHFYEFLCLDSNKIFPAWQLQKNQVVEPILTSGNGLIRYSLGDQVRVTDFLAQTPCLEFLVRKSTSDLVGEKLSHEIALGVLNQLRAKYSASFFTLIAQKNPRPHYALACNPGQYQELADFTEKLLCESHHYRLARELGQLSRLKLLPLSTLEQLNEHIKTPMLAGQLKLDPIMQGNG